MTRRARLHGQVEFGQAIFRSHFLDLSPVWRWAVLSLNKAAQSPKQDRETRSPRVRAKRPSYSGRPTCRVSPRGFQLHPSLPPSETLHRRGTCRVCCVGRDETNLHYDCLWCGRVRAVPNRTAFGSPSQTPVAGGKLKTTGDQRNLQWAAGTTVCGGPPFSQPTCHSPSNKLVREFRRWGLDRGVTCKEQVDLESEHRTRHNKRKKKRKFPLGPSHYYTMKNKNLVHIYGLSVSDTRRLLRWFYLLAMWYNINVMT